MTPRIRLNVADVAKNDVYLIVCTTLFFCLGFYLWSTNRAAFQYKALLLERHNESDTKTSGRRRHASELAPEERKPQAFKRPTASPNSGWSLTETEPIMYRPFRHKYHSTMGLRSMDWNEWIELDKDFLKYHGEKARRIQERGSRCARTHPDAWDAAIELLEELRDYLTERYPMLYRRTSVGMDNIATSESFNIVERPLKEDPMQMAARWTQDDLAIMVGKPDGQYYLLAGSIFLAGFWRLEDKFQMSLSEIHTSGDVPEFREKLEKGMMNFFRRLTPDKPMLRNNYFIQVGDELAWSSTLGSEDQVGHGWFSAEKDWAIQHHMFRSERQSLRRLPRSGAIVFTIRTYLVPITRISDEPYVPGRLASAVRSWGSDASRYKGKETFGKVLLEYVDKRHEEQIASGLDMTKEDELYNYPL